MKMGFKLPVNMADWRHEQVVVYKVRLADMDLSDSMWPENKVKMYIYCTILTFSIRKGAIIGAILTTI